MKSLASYQNHAAPATRKSLQASSSKIVAAWSFGFGVPVNLRQSEVLFCFVLR